MNQKTQHGYLVLADISGYTSYLAGVELTHARDILTELLKLIVEHFKPFLSIVKLEGDAVHRRRAHLVKGWSMQGYALRSSQSSYVQH